MDYVGERPTMARLLLREVSDATAARQPAVVDHARPILAAMEELIREGQKKGLFQPLDPDPSRQHHCGRHRVLRRRDAAARCDWPHDPLSREQFGGSPSGSVAYHPSAARPAWATARATGKDRAATRSHKGSSERR